LLKPLRYTSSYSICSRRKRLHALALALFDAPINTIRFYPRGKKEAQDYELKRTSSVTVEISVTIYVYGRNEIKSTDEFIRKPNVSEMDV